MSIRRAWCDVCRGGADGSADDLVQCSTCPRKFHRECVKIPKKGVFTCPHCSAGSAETAQEKQSAATAKACITRVRGLHAKIRARSSVFYRTEKKRLAPFLPHERLKKLMEAKAGAGGGEVPRIQEGPIEYIKAELRDYQVAGVNW